MWKVPVRIDGYEKQINYPSICPLSPERGKAFCTNHCATAQKATVGLHKFLIHSGKEKSKNGSESGIKFTHTRTHTCDKVSFC